MKRWLWRIFLFATLASVVSWGAVWGAAQLIPLPEDFFEPGSQVVAFDDGSFAHVFLSPDEKWRINVKLEEVDSAFTRALVRLEDKRFFAHGGVDLSAVLRAAVGNLAQRRVVSGASTITMQLVRVREPRPRTLVSKVKEAFRALQLEGRLTKSQILAAYLQYVPYGRNIEGIEAASLSYFGHRPSALSGDEIATLLAVPQNPNRRYPTKGHAVRLKAARDGILERLSAWEVLPEGAVKSGLSTAVPTRLHRFPRLAPHAAYWLRAQQPTALRIHSTLSRGAQKQAEDVVVASAESLRHRGISHAAVVVVDHSSGEVKALAGSAGFWSGAEGSQIASFAVPRSPGSALKPVIYGLALDAGQVLPEHLVLDVPVAYGNYVPKNYDGRFSGLVRAEQALSKSLNVPFVNMLQRVGVDRLIGNLQSWGVQSLQTRPGYYGLSAAIGGLELSPLELAGLYAMLARGGRHRSLSWRQDMSGEADLPGLSGGAAYLVQRALRIKDRPDFPARRRFTGTPASISWKTGTSYGHRDAWAAGSNPRHTAVVWLGNLDQRPSGYLVGAQAAGPLLFDVLEGLQAGTEAALPQPPKDLTRVEVCQYSGHVPGPGCAKTQFVWARQTAVPLEVCPYHVAMDIDVQSGLALAPRCRAHKTYQTQKFLVWPARLRRWLKDSARHAPQPPEFLAGCEGTPTLKGPRIISPGPGHLAVLIPGVDPGDQQIPLTSESGSHRVSWFVDGEFLGAVETERPLWWRPAPGQHTAVVVDEAGRSVQRTFRVQLGFASQGS